MAYVDFDYYAFQFGGTAIGSPELFTKNARKAEAYIDKITFGQIIDVTDAVKNAVCAVCDIFAGYDHVGVASESNDGYSVSYSSDESARAREMYKAAQMFLPSELLYRGISE